MANKEALKSMYNDLKMESHGVAYDKFEETMTSNPEARKSVYKDLGFESKGISYDKYESVLDVKKKDNTSSQSSVGSSVSQKSNQPTPQANTSQNKTVAPQSNASKYAVDPSEIPSADEIKQSQAKRKEQDAKQASTSPLVEGMKQFSQEATPIQQSFEAQPITEIQKDVNAKYNTPERVYENNQRSVKEKDDEIRLQKIKIQNNEHGGDYFQDAGSLWYYKDQTRSKKWVADQQVLKNLENERSRLATQANKANASLKPELDKAVKNATSKDIDKLITTGSSSIGDVKVPNQKAIIELADKISKEKGLGENSYYSRLLQNAIGGEVSFQIKKPEIEAEFEKQFKAVKGQTYTEFTKSKEKESLELAKNFAELEATKKEASNQIQQTLKAEYKPEFTMVSEGYKQQLQDIETAIKSDVEIKQAVGLKSQELQTKYQSLVNNGSLSVEEATEQLNGELTKYSENITNEKYPNVFENAYQNYLDSLNGLNQKRKARYTREFAEVQSKIVERQKAIKSENEALFKKDPNLEKEINAIYNKAYNNVLSNEDQRMLSAEQGWGSFGALKNSFMSALGSSLKGTAIYFNSRGLEKVGASMESENLFIPEESHGFSDWLDLSKVMKNVGSIAGSMTTTMLPAIGVTLASGGLGAPTAVNMLLGAGVAWTGETTTMVGNIKNETFAKTGSVADAEEAGRQMFQAQIDNMYLYSLGMLPFTGALNKWFTGIRKSISAPIKLGLAGGIETVAETTQEFYQGSQESAISEYLDVRRANEFRTKENFKKTFITVAPVGILGMLGQAGDLHRQYKTNKSVNKDIVALKAKTLLNQEMGTVATNQYLFDMVANQGADFAMVAMEAMYTQGVSNKEQFNQSLKAIQQSTKNLAEAKDLGLNDGQAKVYSTIMDEIDSVNDELRLADTEFKVNILEDRKKILEKELSNYANTKKTDRVIVQLADDSQFVITSDEVADMMKNPEFAMSVRDGDISVGISDSAKSIEIQDALLANLPTVSNEEVANKVREKTPLNIQESIIYERNKSEIDTYNKGLESETTQETTPTQTVNENISIEERVKNTLNSIKNKSLFSDGGSFSSALGGSETDSVPIERSEVNGIELVQFANPNSGEVDVIMTGTSDHDYVGYYRIYENGKATNKWSSKFENQSRNKSNFKTMITEAQKALPENHEYTEKDNISTDGLRIFAEQLNRGYELQYDEQGNLITSEVRLNGASLINDLGIEVSDNKFNDIQVNSNEEFESVKKALLPYLKRFNLNESNVKREGNRVVIDLPILLSNKPSSTENKSVSPADTQQEAQTEVEVKEEEVVTETEATPTEQEVVTEEVEQTDTEEKIVSEESEISEEEYNDFIDKGNVTKERLTSIAEKVKNKEELSPREQEIFMDKTSEINNIIKEEAKQTTDKPTVSEPKSRGEETVAREEVKVSPADTKVEQPKKEVESKEKEPTKEEVDKEDRRIKNNRLFDLVRQHDKLPKNSKGSEKIGRPLMKQIQELAKDLGYTIGHGGKNLNIINDKGKPIAKQRGKTDNIEVSAEETEHAKQEVKNNGWLFEWGGDMFDMRLDLGGVITWSDIRKGYADIKAGKDSVPARRLIKAINEQKEKGGYNMVMGGGSMTARGFISQKELQEANFEANKEAITQEVLEKEAKEFDEYIESLSEKERRELLDNTKEFDYHETEKNNEGATSESTDREESKTDDANKETEKQPIKQPKSEGELAEVIAEVFGLKDKKGKPNKQAKSSAKLIAKSIKGLIDAGVFKSEKEFWDAFPTMTTDKPEGISQDQMDKAKGYISLARNAIHAFIGSDVSTPLHEVSHWWLANIDASAKNGNQKAKRITEALDRFAKSPQGKAYWDNEYGGKFNPNNEVFRQELFARGFENYLRDGKAPDNTLKSLFDEVSNWFKEIYQSLADLGIEINGEMSNVYSYIMTGDDVHINTKPTETQAKIENDINSIIDDIINIDELPDADDLFQLKDSARNQLVNKIKEYVDKALEKNPDMSYKQFASVLKGNPKTSRLFDVLTNKEIEGLFRDKKGNTDADERGVNPKNTRKNSYTDRAVDQASANISAEMNELKRTRDVTNLSAQKEVADKIFDSMLNSPNPTATFEGFNKLIGITTSSNPNDIAIDSMIMQKIRHYYADTLQDGKMAALWTERIQNIGGGGGVFNAALANDGSPESLANAVREGFKKEQDEALAKKQPNGKTGQEIIDDVKDAIKTTPEEAKSVSQKGVKTKGAKDKAKNKQTTQRRKNVVVVGEKATADQKKAKQDFKAKAKEYLNSLKDKGLLQNAKVDDYKGILSEIIDDIIAMGAKSKEQALNTFISEMEKGGMSEADAISTFNEVWSADNDTEMQDVVAQDLANSIVAKTKSDTTVGKKETDPIKILARALLAQVADVIPKETRKGIRDKKPLVKAYEKLAEVISNKGIANDAWVKALESIKETVNANSDLSGAEKAEIIANVEDLVSNFLNQPLPKTVLRQAVKDGIKDLGIEIDKVIENGLTDEIGTGKSLAERIVEQTGLDAISAQEIADSVVEDWNKILGAKKETLVAIQLAKAEKSVDANAIKEAEKQQKALDKLQELKDKEARKEQIGKLSATDKQKLYLSETEDAKSESETKVEELSNEIKSLEKEMKEAISSKDKESINDLTDELNKKRRDLSNEKNKLKTLNEKQQDIIDKIQETIDDLYKKIEDKNEKSVERNNIREAEKQQRALDKFQKLRESQANAKDKAEKAEKRKAELENLPIIERKKVYLRENEKNISDTETEVSKKENEITDLESETSSLEREIPSLENDMREAISTGNKQEEQRLAIELTNKRREINKNKAKLDLLRNGLDKLNEKLDNLNEKQDEILEGIQQSIRDLVIPKEKKPTKQKATLDKIMEAMNQGVLNDDVLTKAFADKFGFGYLTNGQIQRLKELKEEMANVAGIERKNKAKRNLVNYLATLDRNTSRKVFSFLGDTNISQMLSGIRTWTMNIPIGSLVTGVYSNFGKIATNAGKYKEYRKLYKELGLDKTGAFLDILKNGYNQLDDVDAIHGEMNEKGSIAQYIKDNGAGGIELDRFVKNKAAQKIIKGYLNLQSKFQIFGYFANAFDAIMSYNVGEYDMFLDTWERNGLNIDGSIRTEAEILQAVKEEMGYDGDVKKEVEAELEETRLKWDAEGFDYKQEDLNRERRWLMMQKREIIPVKEALQKTKSGFLMGTPTGAAGFIYEQLNRVNYVDKESKSLEAILNTLVFTYKMTLMPFLRIATKITNIVFNSTPILGSVSTMFFELKPVSTKDANTGKITEAWRFVPKTAKERRNAIAYQTAITGTVLGMLSQMFKYDDDEEKWVLDPNRLFDFTLKGGGELNSDTPSISIGVNKGNGEFMYFPIDYVIPLIAPTSILGFYKERSFYRDFKGQTEDVFRGSSIPAKIGYASRDYIEATTSGLSEVSFMRNLRIIKQMSQGDWDGLVRSVSSPFKMALPAINSNLGRDVGNIAYDIADIPQADLTPYQQLLGGITFTDPLYDSKRLTQFGKEKERKTILKDIISQFGGEKESETALTLIKTHPNAYVQKRITYTASSKLGKKLEDRGYFVTTNAKIKQKLEAIAAEEWGNILDEKFKEDYGSSTKAMSIQDVEKLFKESRTEARKRVESTSTTTDLKTGEFLDVEMFLYKRDRELFYEIFPKYKGRTFETN